MKEELRVSLHDRLMDDLKVAMRSGDEPRREAIRLVRAAIHNDEIERGHALSDSEIEQVIGRLARRHRESIDEFERANRADLVARERAQLSAIETYLPDLAPASAFEAQILAAIEGVGATNPRDQGKVMARLAPELRGKVDMARISQMVRERLERIAS